MIRHPSQLVKPSTTNSVSKSIIKLIPAGALATALPLITSYGTLTNKLGNWYIDFIVEYLENGTYVRKYPSAEIPDQHLLLAVIL